MEQAATEEREKEVNAKIAAAASVAKKDPVVSQQPTVATTQPASPAKEELQQPSTAVVHADAGSDTASADRWTTKEVLAWASATVPGNTQFVAALEKENVDGEKLLFSFTSRDMETRFHINGMAERRKLEYALQKLRDPILERRQQEQEAAKRVMEGRIERNVLLSEEKKLTRETQSKALAGGMFVYVSHTERSVTIEVDNVSSLNPPQPAIVKVEIKDDAANVDTSSLPPSSLVTKSGPLTTVTLWVAPNVPLKMNAASAGGSVIKESVITKETTPSGRVAVFSGRVADATKPLVLSYRVSYVSASLADFCSYDNDRKLQMVASTLQQLELTTEMVNQMSVAELEAFLASKNAVFVDPAFPPVSSSLYMDAENPPANSVPVQWKRPFEFLEPGVAPTLFEGLPNPMQIQQGRLGDCWFLGALSILPARRVFEMFETTKVSPFGLYAVRFFRGGKRVRVIVDDFLPCTPTTGWLPYDLTSVDAVQAYLKGTGIHSTGGPVYSRALDSSLWLCVLEKAYAKLSRSYQALAGGNFAESLSDLTGAPSVNYFLPWHDDREAVFNTFHKAYQQGMLMGCSTRSLTEEERATGFQLEKYGIVGRHAYGILQVRRLKNGLRLLRLRNPWGRFVWNGDYSDTSNKWTLVLKDEVQFKEEPGAFWMEWGDFQSFFHSITLSLVGMTDNWKTDYVLNGVYDKDHLYGPQCFLSVDEPMTVLISATKDDLRYATGADVDNRQGIYLLQVLQDGSFEFLSSTGEFSSREVTLMADLEPGKRYMAMVMSQIGNLKFTSVPFVFSIKGAGVVHVSQETPTSERITQAMVCDLRAHLINHDRFTSEIYALQHLCFMYSVDGAVSNRTYVAKYGGVELVLEGMKRYPKERDLNNVSASLLWNLACSPDVRDHIRDKTDAVTVLQALKGRSFNDVEIDEVCDVATRNIHNKGNVVAMDPLIESCIIKDACTFSVTGEKTFLLQVWYDCITCNLRSNFGICQTCASVCHEGHELSAPKFSRFFCDCGQGKAAKKSKSIVPCKCVKDAKSLGLAKKREKDRNYHRDDHDDD